MNIPNIPHSVKQIDRGKRFQIYKEACLLGAAYNKALRAVDLRVFAELSSYLNHESYSAFPGVKTLLSTLPISRRTLFRSFDKLEAEGHLHRRRRWNKAKRRSDSTVYVPLIPDAVMPSLRIRFANQPDALAILASAAKQIQARAKMTLGSGVEMTPGSGVEMTPEPLTEPLREPLSYTGSDLASLLSDNPFSDFKQGKEKRLGEEGKAERVEIFRLARQYFGDRGASLAAKAMVAGMPEPEVLEIINEGIEVGAWDADYLGQALSLAWSKW